ncbi:hypothetical protein EV193_10268 [Herbihabitans rhizosphaerae]|uniref:Uncharacterized protein n=1 Tax=Herbihabitans rhizosphaerae TaxID=1872711 RepID=A0A4Q7L4G3_9PSEU|nr:hypothetical protein [Herbihabitans rhizosphaerae]RZS43092.1 hypothetical protein EV193_10268 [Herbihabitans rhizosphaerae]
MTGDVVFDEGKLRAFAAELRSTHNSEQLKAQLIDGLVGPDVFGPIEGGARAANGLRQTLTALLADLERIGVDTAELASNAIAAADQATSAARRTEAAARGGRDR